MIQESEKILAEVEQKINEIVKGFHDAILKSETEKKLTINSVENIIGTTLEDVKNAVNEASSEYLSNVDTEETEKHCSCGKRMVNVKKKNK
jgi:ribosomal protein L7/L12